MKFNILNKIFLAIVILLFAGNSITAQTVNEGKVRFLENSFIYGPKVGVNIAKPIHLTNELRTELKSNYQIGLFFRAGKRLFFQPEIYYSVEKENRILVSDNTATPVSVHYLTVPVLLGLKVFDFGVIGGHLSAGPKGKIYLSESIYEFEYKGDKFTYDLQVGAGIDFLNALTIDVRYKIDINENTINYIEELDFGGKLNFSVGFIFR